MIAISRRRHVTFHKAAARDYPGELQCGSSADANATREIDALETQLCTELVDAFVSDCTTTCDRELDERATFRQHPQPTVAERSARQV